MSEKSDEFERLNARIRTLMMGSGASVEWDGEIADPDSPSEMRQIDVLITTSDGRRLAVECRDRSKPQIVMWIEELAGRKESLKLDGIIAVAMNGFTPLAAKKAARFGIALYDFVSLSDDEIASWAGAARVRARFLEFDRLEIVAVMARGISQMLPLEPAFLRNDICGYHSVMASLRENLEGKELPATGVVALDPADFRVGGVRPIRLSCQFAVDMTERIATCTSVLMHDRPEIPYLAREVSVERFDHSVREIITHDKKLHLLVDVDNISSPDNSILHEISIHSPTATILANYELVGTRRLTSQLTTVLLAVTDTTE